MDRFHVTIRTLLVASWLVPAWLGCRSFTPQVPLPGLHQVRRPGIVLYSDFRTPASRHLLDELVAERAMMNDLLALPPSTASVDIYLFETAVAFRDFISRRYPEFPRRRAFFVEGDSELAVYAHCGDRVAEDLRHEVAHAYLHAAVSNVPLWLDEGIAEYFELPAGSHGLSELHLAELAGARRRGDWAPNMARLSAIESAAEMTQIDYAEAWAWTHLFLQTTAARRARLQAYLRMLRQGRDPGSLVAFAEPWLAPPTQVLTDHLARLDGVGLDRRTVNAQARIAH